MINKFLDNDLNDCIKNKKRKKIIDIGIHYGFLNDNYRFECYLILFELNLEKITNNFVNLNESKIEEINQSNIIKKDLLRTFQNRNFIGINNLNKEDLMNNLGIIISNFFNNHKEYTYYQGFNSLGEILYLKYGKPFSLILLEEFCKLYFIQYLKKSYVEVMQIKINQIKIILKNYYPYYYNFIKKEYINKLFRIYFWLVFDLVFL